MLLITIILNVLFFIHACIEGIRSSYYERVSDKKFLKIDISILTKIQELIILISINSLSIYVFGYFTIILMIVQVLLYKYFLNLFNKCTKNNLKNE